MHKLALFPLTALEACIHKTVHGSEHLAPHLSQVPGTTCRILALSEISYSTGTLITHAQVPEAQFNLGTDYIALTTWNSAQVFTTKESHAQAGSKSHKFCYATQIEGHHLKDGSGGWEGGNELFPLP